MKRALLFIAALLGLLTASSPARAEVTLRFVIWDGDEYVRAQEPAIRDFEKAHPGVKVKLESVTNNYMTRLLAQYAAGVAPDVVMMDPFSFHKFARRGALLPLNDFMANTPGFDIKQYYPSLVDAMSADGKHYVLPKDIAPQGIIFYNKKLFDEAGIPYPDGTWTWDFQERPELKEKDFLWVMHQLTKKDDRGRTTQYGYAVGWTNLFVETIAFSLGARYVDDYKEPHKTFYDDPRFIRAFDFLLELTKEKKWVPGETELNTVLQTGALKLFTEGKVAMYQTGAWEIVPMRRDIKPGAPGFFEWDITLAPAYKNGQLVTPTGGSGYAIMAGTKHPKEAWALASWMGGEPGMSVMAAKGLSQPARMDMSRRAPWVPDANTPPEQRYPANRAVTDVAAQHVLFPPTHDFYPQVQDRAFAENEKIVNGSKTPAEVLGEGNRLAQARLNLLWSQEKSSPPFDWVKGWMFGGLLALGLVAWVYWPERKKKLTQAMKKENRMGYLFITPWLIGIVGLTLGPMLLSLMMSFASWDIVTDAKWRGPGNFIEMVTADPRFFPALKVTAVYTAVAVPVGLTASFLLALLLNVDVKGIPLYRTCFYLPTLASGVANALVWKKIFQADGGLLNTIIYGPHGDGNFLGLAAMLRGVAGANGQVNWIGNEKTALASLILMSLWGAGGGTVVLLAGLQGIPKMLYEAATLDGAGPWARTKAVTLPMMSPYLLFSLVTGMIGTLQAFTEAFVMTGGGPGDSTRFYMLHLYTEAFEGLRMGYSSALAWVLFFVILAVTALQFWLSKRFVYYEGDIKK